MVYNKVKTWRRLNMTLGSAIRRLRGERNLQLNELAVSIEQDPSYLGKIERGKIENVSSRLVGRIAEALDVSTDYLYVEAGWLRADHDPRELNLMEQRLISIIRAIPSPDIRQRVLEELIWIAQVARDADLARRPALKLVAEKGEAYKEEG